MFTVLRPALALFTLLTLVCGVLYPTTLTALGRLAFPEQTAGSLVLHDGRPLGSRLIGQSFTASKYFWGRPSATRPKPNDAANSGAANLGPSNPAQIDAVKARVAALKAADPSNPLAIPIDLVTASASGLDPEISLAAAYYQAPRIARERHLSIDRVRALIERHQQALLAGFLGEPRVNVLELNLALDAWR